MTRLGLFTFLVLSSVALGDQVRADQWGSKVLAHCYDLDSQNYSKHMFVRVFWTEIGGGQLRPIQRANEGVTDLWDLAEVPFSCAIGSRQFLFEAVDFRPQRERGACALCESTGFRLSVDGVAIWDVAAPKILGGPIFRGTLDVGRDAARVCTERWLTHSELELLSEPESSSVDVSILTCENISYH